MGVAGLMLVWAVYGADVGGLTVLEWADYGASVGVGDLAVFVWATERCLRGFLMVLA